MSDVADLVYNALNGNVDDLDKSFDAHMKGRVADLVAQKYDDVQNDMLNDKESDESDEDDDDTDPEDAGEEECDDSSGDDGDADPENTDEE